MSRYGGIVGDRSYARIAGAVSVLIGLILVALAGPTHAGKVKHGMKIQEVKSPGGITAWLVEEPSVPLIALRFAFEGGSSQDPDGKPGVANFLTVMMDEGAGDLDARAFQERMEDIAMRLNFSDGRDALYGGLQTLSEHRDEAAALLKLALTKPRFDSDAIERMRKQLLSNLAFAAKNPDRVARNEWGARAFPGHPYGLPTTGTLESVRAINADDLEDYRRRLFARSNLKIAVVGDITAKELGGLLDNVFGDLPAKPALRPVAATAIASPGKTTVIEMPVPQSVVVMGLDGIARDDPDFVPAYVMNHILGGGGFAARLMSEVREKRGLAYSVSSHLIINDKAATVLAFVATKNEKVAESIDVISTEIRRLADNGVSEQELNDAKNYLTGSYALRFDTNSKIANQLLGIQMEDLGIDFVNTRNDMINAVTVDDIKRVAKRLMLADRLSITVVGQPQNLASGG